MDPFSILSSVFSATVSVLTWLDNLEQANATIQDLHRNILLIHNIIHPLNGRPSLPPSVVMCLLAIGEDLCSIQEHLMVLKSGKVSQTTILAFLFPSNVTSKLKSDNDLLMQRIQLLQTAVLTQPYTSPTPQEGIGLLDSVGNSSVRQFWSDIFRNEDAYVTREQFRVGLDTLSHLSEEDFDTLWLRLDEFGMGVVTPMTLDAFVGDRSKSLKDTVRGIQSYPIARLGSSNDGCKVLLWVDDNPGNNEGEVTFALKCNIQVYQFTSTAAVKDWLEQHPGKGAS
ncbi:hypothetical protein GLOTRDRAFT_131867 [Gloeophyllum trabeum ATCC 11539]|uniref:Uncharacterized protein n=1 Tax=Gloeophyllum trabeum (strain ATCC 11539 / FP-39264 / Madison 617) TaxID=670483 RepID=S7PZB0_GLOTA|nr:uncharacterized protein GLOTRDRAFT_131867 [Gloeophyllum trabeum ATCC 11539]EPQ52632.1 hypothetical protein GLOTRDRAFT_131867 [Gloeophyllum trabeum ATCC 11539]